jgi:hypothetical protein
MKPYTYYLYHHPTGLKYYGVRYAKNCDPKDLWDKYFTSCKKVKELINEYGINSFEVEIRKIFENKIDAINWENKVLRRLKVKRKKEWINISEGKMPFDNITYGMLGKHHSEDSKKKIALAQLGSKNHMFNKTHSAEARKKISEGNKGKKHSEETKTTISKKMKGRDVGFGKGHKHTPETIEKIKMARAKQIFSEEHKKKMSESAKNRKKSTRY